MCVKESAKNFKKWNKKLKTKQVLWHITCRILKHQFHAYSNLTSMSYVLTQTILDNVFTI